MSKTKMEVLIFIGYVIAIFLLALPVLFIPVGG